MVRALSIEKTRIIFYGFSVFFVFMFLALAFDTPLALSKNWHTNQLNFNSELGRKVALGKLLWEQHDCIGCHTLVGEGAYFASELSNVYQRYNNSKDTIKNLIRNNSFGHITGTRVMPRYDLTDKELDALAEFLKYSSKTDTAHWPPHKEG